MNTTDKKAPTKVFKTEKEIENTLGEFYNKTMCHKMKSKDTTSTCFPTNGLWKPEVLYKTTNEVVKPTGYTDPYYDDKNHYKKSFEKAYNEERAKADNIIKQRKMNESDKKTEQEKPE